MLQENLSHILKKRKRVILFTSVGILAISGIAVAVSKVIDYPVQRDGRETRLDVMMSVPYGTLVLAAGTDPKNVALLEMQSADDESMPFHVRYSYNPLGTKGTLRMTIGSDEGMLETNPPLAHAWKANSNFSLVSSNKIQSDYGNISPSRSQASYDMMNAPIATTADESDHAKVFLTRNIPVSINAQLGFGESVLDWTGLSLSCAYVETGTAKTEVHLHEKNPIPMNGCKINAGFGEFSMDGICNLNTDRFYFSGGVGYYSLSFTGKLPKDMTAQIEVGMGKVALNIPPEAGRVQVIYDDSYFSSFTFSGLVKRKDGYYTSVGFDNSKAPILTLKLSSGLGKMIVNYH